MANTIPKLGYRVIEIPQKKYIQRKEKFQQR